MPLKPKRLSQTYTRMTRGPVVIGDILYRKGGSFGPRTQHDYQLVVIHSGSLTLNLDGETIDVPENHGILLSPGHREHFFFAADSETRHSWVAIDPSSVAANLRKGFGLSRGPMPFLGRMASLLDFARKEFVVGSEENVVDNGFYYGLALAILCDFSATVTNGGNVVQANQTVLWKMDRFLAESFSRPLVLNDIARAIGVSRQHLLKLCRGAGRPTPIKQLYAKRLEAATDLLLHTGFSIAEIADQCGFVNQFHFSRKFKEILGCSPSTWRGRLWKASSSKSVQR